MVRLFVALPLPLAQRRILALAAGGVPGARWTPLENYHVTLRFIGEVDERRADDIVSALDTVHADAFTLGIGGVGTFDSRRDARLLYARVLPVPALLDLEGRIGAALARVPGLDLEPRRFVPHVTLARLRQVDMGRLGAFIEGNGLLATPDWRVDHFALYSSDTGGDHSVYTLEERFDLDDDAGGDDHDGWADDGGED
ncbi:RNA 2',3'-cyclic phosphodiesterase [Zavarzinia compransoris]|uniref:RNA 2',3'-cyclic phosphodiesterase n=1 Tax=Zavarzinia compransoris TaxID=1264899 RepID=A0A317E490_9PROT|nr:RNA 2',3'-cyclic phosphodiesterase [Zavarzinia compransoris]PWR21938.1 RNA 2',3'-cyclic phosphodiesterase [Zavarzinia compransoris]TDP47325.1 2'-5' RNA ligase [Zavarzinia compransoris]